MTETELDFNEFSRNEIIDAIKKINAKIDEAKELKQDTSLLEIRLVKLQRLLDRLK